MRSALLSLVLAVLLIPSALAKGSGGHAGSPHGSRSAKTTTRSTPRTPRSTRCTSCARDTHGRIQRHSTAKHAFERSNPCPSTGRTSRRCPGYVIDHVTPLKRGGADTPSNMQWQTKETAKGKDKPQRRGQLGG